MLPKYCVPIAGMLAASAVSAADLIPLKNGIYVPVASMCKGASRAEMVNYWGGRSSIGSGMAECRIRKITHKRYTYVYTDVCTDIASGEKIEGGTTTVTVTGPAAFKMGDGKQMDAYKYCGTKPQF
jgi:hypothetical protein